MNKNTGQGINLKQIEYYKDEDLSAVTQKELSGFYGFNIAVFGYLIKAEGYSVLAVSVIYPIILKGLAAANAVETFNHDIKCNVTKTDYKCDVNLGGLYIDTSALVLYATSFSVCLQFLTFISLSSLADHGTHRKQLMMFFGYVTAAIGLCNIFVIDESWYLMIYAIFIISNTTFGAGYVFNYAWVPILTTFSPSVIEARENPTVTEDEYHSISDACGNEISSKGFLSGYLSGTIQLILVAGFIVFAPRFVGDNQFYNSQIGIALTCIFQIFTLAFYVQKRVKTRPGPPLPAGRNYIGYSLSSLWKTLKQASTLTQLFRFLIAWFFYSDSYATVVSSALIFAQGELGADINILLVSSIIVPLVAAIGNVVWNKMQTRYGWTTKKMIIIQASLYSLLPLYGLLGFFAEKGAFFGLNSKYEIPVFGIYHGFLLGATQSSCRVMFSELLPRGHESQFFGLYEISDKGSSWIGPLIVAAITSWTKTIRWSFIMIFVTFLIPIAIFASIDVKEGKKEAKIFALKNSHRKE